VEVFSPSPSRCTRLNIGVPDVFPPLLVAFLAEAERSLFSLDFFDASQCIFFPAPFARLLVGFFPTNLAVEDSASVVLAYGLVPFDTGSLACITYWFLGIIHVFFSLRSITSIVYSIIHPTSKHFCPPQFSILMIKFLPIVSSPSLLCMVTKNSVSRTILPRTDRTGPIDREPSTKTTLTSSLSTITNSPSFFFC